MNFRHKKLIILLLCFSALGLTSCKNETDIPISLKGGANTSFDLPYPYSKINYSIQGGDGQYSVSCDKPDIVQAVMVSAVEVQVQVLAVGDAVVTVSDKSSHVLELQIHVDYDKSAQINRHDVVIAGDLTDEETEAIRTEALRTIPVQDGGGYLFFPYIWADNGTVIIYPDEFGSDGIESFFEIKRISWIPPDGIETQNPACCININGEERVFLILMLNSDFNFCEELTDRFKSRYPGLEWVYTLQVLRYLIIRR